MTWQNGAQRAKTNELCLCPFFNKMMHGTFAEGNQLLSLSLEHGFIPTDLEARETTDNGNWVMKLEVTSAGEKLL